VPHTAPTGCNQAQAVENTKHAGYQPAELSAVYNHDLDASHDGTGETIGFVEF
jgi:hypothetical protein